MKKGTQEGGRERDGETTNSTSCGFSTGPSSIIILCIVMYDADISASRLGPISALENC